ncbi:hypothetical protein LCGC14_0577730 [marine sediment metagenome]|uniref:Serine protease n=1 Tax=marine sediment metagenome TaxID=412755 RepID=A0A0F9S0W6_9ZZZZ
MKNIHSYILTVVITVGLVLTFISWGVAVVKSPKMVHQVNLPDMIQEVMPSAVHIMCDQWQGSGVALTPDIVATARHVVDGVNYTVTLNNGCRLKGYQAVSHKDYDIGFIKVGSRCVAKRSEHSDEYREDNTFLVGHKVELKPAEFGSIDDCVLGQSVFIVGSPYGKINYNNVTLGIVSGLDKDWDSLSRYGEPYGWKIAFTSDSAAHPGNSGGPVFSMDGVVRGLLVGGFSPVLNCSMPSDLFLDDVELIKMLFAQEKYKVEKENTSGPEDWYGNPIEIESHDYYMSD